MPWLKYYEKERERFSKEYATKLNDNELKYAFERLKNHYHIDQELIIRGQRGHGHCWRWRIVLSHESSVGMLAHEVAHAIQWNQKRANEKWHTKRHAAIMKQVSQYLMSHIDNWRIHFTEKQREERQRPELTICSNSVNLSLCPSCGTVVEMRKGINFCHHCGFKVSNSNESHGNSVG
jgi:membrane-anchored protein YejM (alkaline phosphatase superfamily)